MSSDPAQPPWYEGNAFRMLVLLLSVYVVGSFMGTDGLGAHLINLFTVGAVLVGLRTLTGNRRVFVAAAVLMLGLLITSWVVHSLLADEGYILDTATSLVFFGFVLAAFLKVTLRSEPVTTDKIFAAICAYLLMGICWGFAFNLIHTLDPDALALSPADRENPEPALIHYSFTTLTTVGYGSISPVGKVARSFSDLEAVVGQLYIAIVIARLVSLQITHKP